MTIFVYPPIVEAAARTTVVTLLQPHEQVFNRLADIENLPCWAGGFCEKLFLSRGGWMALTSLGELHLALEADARSGIVILHAGWEATRLWALALRVTRCPEGGTWVKFALAPGAGEDAARLHLALEREVRGLVEWFGGIGA